MTWTFWSVQLSLKLIFKCQSENRAEYWFSIAKASNRLHSYNPKFHIFLIVKGGIHSDLKEF